MERGSLYYESDFDNEYEACIDFLKPLGFYSKESLMNISDHEEDRWYFLDKQNIFYFYALFNNSKQDLAIMLNQYDIEMYRQQGRQALIQIYEKLQLMN